jgi:transposase
MAHGYLSVDRDQQFLLPPDVRDWLPEDHLAWFVLEVVERVDTSVLHARHRNDGVGRRAYDPDMLLALLVYAYCTGQRSSRQIERRCEADVAYRVIAANWVPDHTTIARFRQVHDTVAQRLFVDVLLLCAAAGMARVGVVAVDGTKMGADAALRANRSRSQIEAEVAGMFGQAERVDVAEDGLFGEARGDEPPAGMADRRGRAARLDAALRQLQTQEVASDEAERLARQAVDSRVEQRGWPVGRARQGEEIDRAEAHLAQLRQQAAARYEASLKARAERRGAAKGRTPADPNLRSEVRRAERHLETVRRRLAEQAANPAGEGRPAQVNVTDPDSRVMKTQQGFVQGYNAQAAVNRAGIVLAADVTQDVSDVKQCLPMMAATQASLDAIGVTEPIGTMLFDAGYCSADNLTAAGPDRLIATAKSWKLRRKEPPEDPPGADASPVAAMEHRLRSDDGAALYGLRQQTVEPVFGDIKTNRGFQRFSRRGLPAARAEWKLIAATNNLLKLHRSRLAPS